MSSSSSSFCSKFLTLNGHWFNTTNGIGGLDWFHFLTLIPTCFLLLFLMSKLKRSILILKHSQSLILSTVYTFVWTICVFSVLTSVFNLALILSFSSTGGRYHHHTNNQYTNNNRVIVQDLNHMIGHISIGLLNFVIEFIEIAVIVFMFFSQSQLSHSKVVTRTGFISGMISLCDNAIAVTLSLLLSSNRRNHHNNGGGGGNGDSDENYKFLIIENVYYQIASSSIFLILYLVILSLPVLLSRCPSDLKHRIPQRTGFYVYIALLSLNYGVQLVGAILLLNRIDMGLCVMVWTRFIYFASYAPVLYRCFLGPYFTRQVLDQISVERYLLNR